MNKSYKRISWRTSKDEGGHVHGVVKARSAQALLWIRLTLVFDIVTWRSGRLKAKFIDLV